MKPNLEGIPPVEREEESVARPAPSDSAAARELETVDANLQATTFAKVEKSLITLGFFTPSSRRIKDQKVKRISFTRVIDGKRVEATADGVVYQAGQKKFARDRFHVFERAISVGKEMPDGSISDANYVWLSEWQLENINQNFLLPIDLLTYRQLKNHIAKALVPLLQVWLFASQRAGSFEKRYDELCEMLSLQTYKAPSQITRQFKPSLDELISFGYLKEWRIEKTSDRKAFKFILFHGPKFHRDRRRRLEQKNLAEPPIVVAQSQMQDPELPEPGKIEKVAPTPKRISPQSEKGREQAKLILPDPPPVMEIQGITAPAANAAADEDLWDSADAQSSPAILDELVARGVMASVGMKLLNALSPERLDGVRDYIEFWDNAKSKNDVGPGFLYELIKNGHPLPPSFQTSRQASAHKAAADRQYQMEVAKQSLEFAYDRYRDEALDRYIAEELPKEEYVHLLQVHTHEMSKQGSFFQRYRQKPGFEEMVRNAVRAEIRKTMNVLPFEDFCRREAPAILAEYGIDPAALGIATKPGSADAEPNAEQ